MSTSTPQTGQPQDGQQQTGRQQAGQQQDGPPKSPTDLTARSWRRVLVGAVKEFQDDKLTDSAAALTYYSVLALFPAVLVLMSLIGLAGPDTTRTLIDNLGQVVPGSAQDTIVSTINGLHDHQQTAGVTVVIGLLTGIWSASGYIAAFMRAANVVYDVPEGRPVWKTIPIRLAVTVVLLVLMVAVSLIVVFTGAVAEQAGNLLGFGSAAVTAWGIAKWPVLVVLLMVMVAILYWATPNAKQPGLRWITPGGVLGVLVWVAASALFALYVAHSGSYGKTYGALAGVIIFFVWIWISNLAILFGAEFNAELDRARAEQDGLPVGTEPYMELRDTRKLNAEEKADVAQADVELRQNS